MEILKHRDSVPLERTNREPGVNESTTTPRVRRFSNAAIVVWFMALLVLGTILGYFLLLPKTAPKLITLAVMPFHTSSRVEPYVLHSVARDITEDLSYSRDLTIVDFDSSLEVSALRTEMRGFTAELGASHLLLGSIDKRDAGEVLVTSVLVDISQPAMKEVWNVEISLRKRQFRTAVTQIVAGVRESLYDRGTRIARRSGEWNPDAYDAYLRARYANQQSDREGALTWLNRSIELQRSVKPITMLAGLEYDQRAPALLDEALELDPTYFPARLARARLEFENTRNLVGFHEDLVTLAERFPNSAALALLADLYDALGHHAEAVELRYRVVRTFARDGNIASRLVLSRNRSEAVEDLAAMLELATKRGGRNLEAVRTLWLYQFEHDGNETTSFDDPFAEAVLSGSEEDWDSFDKALARIQEVDWQIIALLHVGRAGEAVQLLLRSSSWWIGPPLWWQETDDRWTALSERNDYKKIIEGLGFGLGGMARVVPANPRTLLMPKREQALRDASPEKPVAP